MTNTTVSMAVVSLTCSACAISDIRCFRVANVYTLPLLISGLLFHLVTLGWSGLVQGLAGAGFGFAALLLPYLLGGMGAGDVKLSAGVGAWLGYSLTYEILIAAALLGGVYALILAIVHGQFRKTISNVGSILYRRKLVASEPVQEVVTQADCRRRLVPFAAMLAVGLLITLVR